MLTRRSLPLLAALLLLPAVASAQVSEADRVTARKLAQQGHDALEAKDYATAADRFGRADAIIHAPTLVIGVARAEVGLGKWITALDLYSRILREGAPAGSPPQWLQAIEDARGELDALEKRMPSVVVMVSGTPSKVTLDGALLPAAELGVTRPVDPGRHVIRAEGAGLAPAEAAVTSVEGKVETVTLELRPAAAATPEIAPSGAPPPAAPPPGSLRRTLGFAAIGVGGAGLLMGAITGGLAIQKHSELAQACPDPHLCTDPSIGAYNTLGGLATAGFVIGGVAAAAGVVLVVTAPSARAASQSSSGASVAPLIGPGWAGVQGRF